jgi:hypothetical protein
MNHHPQHQPDDQQAEFDRLLEAHLGPSASAIDHLVPSSGFAHSVMDAVHQQATAPPPIPFPWKRLLPAAIALLCALLAFGFFTSPQTSTSPAFHFTLSSTAITTITLVAMVIGISIATTAIAFKLSTGRFRI